MRLGNSGEGAFARVLVAVNDGPQRKDLLALLKQISNLDIDVVDDLSMVSPNDIRVTTSVREKLAVTLPATDIEDVKRKSCRASARNADQLE